MKATPLAIIVLIGVLAQGSFAEQEPPYFDLMDMGWELTDPEDLEEAIIVYTRDLKRYQNPAQKPMTLMLRGAAYLNLKKYEEALQDAAAGIVLSKSGSLLIPVGYMLQARVYWETKQMDKVVHFMTKAINLGLLRLTKEVQASRFPNDFAKERKKASEVFEFNEGLNYYMRGIAYADLGENEKSIKDLTKAIEVGFRDSDVYHDRGSIYETLGMYEEAERDFSQALTADGKRSKSMSNRPQ